MPQAIGSTASYDNAKTSFCVVQSAAPLVFVGARFESCRNEMLHACADAVGSPRLASEH